MSVITIRIVAQGAGFQEDWESAVADQLQDIADRISDKPGLKMDLRDAGGTWCGECRVETDDYIEQADRLANNLAGLVQLVRQAAVPGGIDEHEFKRPSGWLERATTLLGNVGTQMSEGQGQPA